MRTLRRKERVPYSASQMFDLVDDVESYPSFLHWCRGAKVERRTATAAVAALDVGLGGIHKRFTTRNTLERPGRIELELVEGPFSSLHGTWRFQDGPEPGCVVELELEFELAHSPLDRLFGMLFEEIVSSQVAAFIHRAEALYG